MKEEAEIRIRRPECDVIRHNCATTIYNTKRATSKADGWRLLPGKNGDPSEQGNGSFGCLAFLSGGASRIKVNERLLVHLEMKKSWFVSREH